MAKNKAAQSLGKLGAAARNKSMSPEARKRIASHAAKTRWLGHKTRQQFKTKE